MRGTKRSKEAQDRATGKGQRGKGLSQDLSQTFLLLFFVMLMAFIFVIWPSFPQHLLGCLLAQYVIWLLRCGNVYVGLNVFGSLVPMTAAALLAVALRARGLRVLLPFTAEGVSVALACAAASLMIIGVLLPLAPPLVATLAIKSSAVMAAILALCLVATLAIKSSAVMAAILALCLVYAVLILAAVMQVMWPRDQPLHSLVEKAGPWLAAEAYITALALSLLADTFAVVLSCVAELRGLLPWPAYLVYGGCGLTDGLVVTPVGVAAATLVAVGLFRLVMRRRQTSGPSGLSWP